MKRPTTICACARAKPAGIDSGDEGKVATGQAASDTTLRAARGKSWRNPPIHGNWFDVRYNEFAK
jgi:hypothetical protein